MLGSPGLWLKADAGVTSSDGNISSWADQSGNGNNFTQTNTIMQPTIGAFKTFPSIRFNGTTNGLATTAINNLDLTGDSTVFVVLQTPGCYGGSQNVVNTFFSQGNFATQPGSLSFWAACPNAAATSGTLSMTRPFLVNGTESSVVVGYASGSPLASGSVFTSLVENSVGSYFVGGANVGSAGNIGTGQSTAVTSIGFFVNGGGVDTNGGSNDYYFHGDIAEIVAYSTAIGVSRTTVECYLSNKYSLGLSECL